MAYPVPLASPAVFVRVPAPCPRPGKHERVNREGGGKNGELSGCVNPPTQLSLKSFRGFFIYFYHQNIWGLP